MAEEASPREALPGAAMKNPVRSRIMKWGAASAGGGCDHGGPDDWGGKRTGQVANSMISGGLVDTHPRTVETTDN